MSSTTIATRSASLVDASKHTSLLDDFMRNDDLSIIIDYLKDGAFALNTHPTNRFYIPVPFFDMENMFLNDFATNVIDRASITMPVLTTALVYVSRAKHYFADIRFEDCPRERVFLGAVMLATKYLVDCSMKNIHWSWCSGISLSSIDTLERDMLAALGYDLSVSEADLLIQRSRILAKSIPRSLPQYAVPPLRAAPAVAVAPRSPVPALVPSSPTSSVESPSPRTPSSPWPEAPPKRFSPLHKLVKSFHLPGRHHFRTHSISA